MRWCDKITQDEVNTLVSKGRLKEFINPTADEVNIAYKNNSFMHDGVNKFILVEARAKRLDCFGYCFVCNGEGTTFTNDKQKWLYEAWKDFEPPTGEGYQLWETCSEGSPISPVFDSVESLAEWCEENTTTFGSFKTSKENWLKMFLEDSLGVNTLLVLADGCIGAGIDFADLEN